MGLDDRTREELTQWMRGARVYLWTFVAGGIFAFACTYSPLHSVKDRKIELLENRLQQSTTRTAAFESESNAMPAQADSQPDREAFERLKGELAAAMTRHSGFEGNLDRADREAKELLKSRDSWKAKYAKLEKSRDDLADALVAANASLKVSHQREKDQQEQSATANLTQR